MMKLLTTRNFNNVALDCYTDGNNNNGDFWATREQIGRLLEYGDPMRAIAHIHQRNADRLDKFSTVVNLSTVEGNRTVTREVIVYNFKGLLEICRFSNQPKANAVMDFLWNVADEIRQNGFYATPAKVEEILQDPDNWIKVLTAYKDEMAKNEKLELKNLQLSTQIAEDKPKVIFADAVATSKDSILIGHFAKILCQNGINVGQNRLFAWFREHGYLIACRGERWNFPKQEYVERGYFEVKKTVVNNPDGTTKVNHTPKITGKGQIYFLNKFLDGSFQI